MAWIKGFLAQKIIDIRELNGQYCEARHIQTAVTIKVPKTEIAQN